MQDRPRNILIVDDNLFFRVSMSEMLTDSGYSVSSVKNGREAIEKIKKDSGGIDLLILDLEMPDVDGFGVLRWLNENGRKGAFSVLMITSIDEPTRVMRSLKKLGAAGFLQKELPHEHLIININRILSPGEKTAEWIRKGRIPVYIPVTFSANNARHEGFLINISEAGALLRTGAECSGGERLTLEFSVGKHVPALKAEGSVRWHTQMKQANAGIYWYGIMFTFMNENDRSALKGLVVKAQKLMETEDTQD